MNAPAIAIGRPIANSTVYVLDGDLRPVAIKVKGEICVGGDGLARGYLDRPDATAERFVPNPFAPGERLYRTGDWGRWHPDGTLEFLGRNDLQVKVRGHRVEPGEIEAVLRRASRACATPPCSITTSPATPRLVAYVVTDGRDAGPALRDHAVQRLPDYLRPSAFVVVDALPLTATGKVDRKALAALDVDVRPAPVEPETETERRDRGRLARGARHAAASASTTTSSRSAATRLPACASPLACARQACRSRSGTSSIIRRSRRWPRACAIGRPSPPRRRRSRIVYRAGGRRRARGAARRRRRSMSAIPRELVEDIHALSPVQQGMFFHTLLEPELAPYVEQGHWRLRGAVDPERFERAWNELAARHTILRSVFRQARRQPVQIVLRRQPIAVPFHDWTSLPAVEQRACAAASCPGQSRRRSASPTVRCCGWRSSAWACDEWRLIWTFHHIILDGLTAAMLLESLCAIYDELAAGATPRRGRDAAVQPFRRVARPAGSSRRRWASGRGTSRASPLRRRCRRSAADQRGRRHASRPPPLDESRDEPRARGARAPATRDGVHDHARGVGAAAGPLQRRAGRRLRRDAGGPACRRRRRRADRRALHQHAARSRVARRRSPARGSAAGAAPTVFRSRSVQLREPGGHPGTHRHHGRRPRCSTARSTCTRRSTGTASARPRSGSASPKTTGRRSGAPTTT